MAKTEKSTEYLANNKKVYHDYNVLETLECGIALQGNEVKSIKAGKTSIKEAWCTVQNGQLVIRGMHVTTWNKANAFDTCDETRERVLLAHKSEIAKIAKFREADGITIMPISIYLVKGRVKVKIGICKGKKLYDKRNDLKNKQVKKDIDRAIKNAMK